MIAHPAHEYKSRTTNTGSRHRPRRLGAREREHQQSTLCIAIWPRRPVPRPRPERETRMRPVVASARHASSSPIPIPLPCVLRCHHRLPCCLVPACGLRTPKSVNIPSRCARPAPASPNAGRGALNRALNGRTKSKQKIGCRGMRHGEES